MKIQPIVEGYGEVSSVPSPDPTRSVAARGLEPAVIRHLNGPAGI